MAAGARRKEAPTSARADRSGEGAARTSSPLNRLLGRFLGPNVPADALRGIGARLLKESAAEAKGLVAALGLVIFVHAAATILTPRAVGRAIDAAGSGRHLTAALVGLSVLLAVTTGASALDDVLSSYYGAGLTARLRHRLLGQGLALGVPGRRRFPPGDVLSRLTENADSPANFVPLLLSAAANLLITVGAVVALGLIDPRLAIAFLLGVPVAVLLLRLFIARAGQPVLRYQEIQAEVVTRLLDAHAGARTIRASGSAERDIGRILEPLPRLHETGRQVWAAQRRVSWQLTLLVPMLQVVVLSVGGFALTAGDISAGQLVAAASYVGLALGSMGLLDTFVALLHAQVGAGRVGEVLDAEVPVTSPARPAAVPYGPGRVEFRDVSVRLDGRTVLDHVDLTAPPGSSVAVVGRSGTGKSVLTSLIGRLRDPDEGEVTLDGVSVRRLELPALRQAVTYAFEQPALLGATVHDTVAYSRPDASRADVERAAAVARADRFIRSLPDGYDTPLDRTPMSGGERQRLGLARAVLAGARVMVLDDATSSLDTATEAQVRDALGEARGERTSVVVAHRPATAARADLVAWLDGGRLRAFAHHEELWARADYRAVFGVDGAAPTAGEHVPPTPALDGARGPARLDGENVDGDSGPAPFAGERRQA